MYKKLYALMLLPFLLYAWGGDSFVAESDTSNGVFILYSAIMDNQGRQAVFAVRNDASYNMDVYLEDSAYAGTFTSVSSPMPFNSRPSEIIPYYNSNDSTTYIVMYTPQSNYSNLHFMPYHSDYSWNYGEIRYIDATPDDTLLYPEFKTVNASGDLYFFVSCVKKTATVDSVFVYTSQDSGDTWQRHFIAYGGSNAHYSDVSIDLQYINDTIFFWRAYAISSNDTLYYLQAVKYSYDPAADDFNYVTSAGSSIVDSFVNNVDLAMWSSKGLMVYDANGAIKVQRITSDSFVGTPTDISSPTTTEYLIGAVKGYYFMIPQPEAYFAIAYTSGSPIFPGTESIVYTETDDGSTFTNIDTLNNNPSTLPVLLNYPKIIYVEPAILYVDVDYHGSFPFLYWDNTTLYTDRRSITSKVKENKHENTFATRSIITNGPLLLNFPVNSEDNININLYSISGRKIKELYSGNVSGQLKIHADISNLPDGIYFVKETNGRLPAIRIMKK